MPHYSVYNTPADKYGDATRLYGQGAETVLRWGFEVDWDGDGLYSGANEAPYVIGFTSRRGRQNYLNIDADGNSQGFEPPRVGTATITLDNTSGRYDPYNASSPLYPNVGAGKYCKVTLMYNGTKLPIIHGKIKRITSIDNPNDSQIKLEIEDGLRFLQSADSFIAIQQSIKIDTAIGKVLDYVAWPTIYGRALDAASDVIPYWWSEDKALTEIRRLSDAELGQFYCAANGNAYFRSRHHSSTPLLTLTSSDFLKKVDVPLPFDVVRNLLELIAHPRTPQSSGTLWQMQDKPSLVAGASLTVWADYTYNNDSFPAINVTAPVPTTDYTFNTLADGTGTDLTSSLSVTLTDFGKRGKLVFKNNHASLSGFITLGKLRGQSLTAYNPSTLIQEDTASQAAFGKRTLTIDNIWFQDTSVTNSFAQYLISFLASGQKFLAVVMEGRPDIQFTPDLFDVLNVTIAKKSISGVNYRVGGIEHDWIIENNGQAVRSVWFLEPAPSLANYWQFTTQIGVTSRFGI